MNDSKTSFGNHNKDLIEKETDYQTVLGNNIPLYEQHNRVVESSRLNMLKHSS